MTNFNEIQKGIPHLDQNYWQDLKNPKNDEYLPNIVNMNCQTIFNPKELNTNTNPPTSVFDK